MKKLRNLVDHSTFQNAILVVIAINAIVMGLQTSDALVASIGGLLEIIDYVCLGIFIVELLLKLVAYGGKFFTDGWNWFDLIIIVSSLVSGLAFLRVLRVFRVFRVFRSLKALKGIKAMRLVSSLDKLRMIIEAIVKSIPGISWTAVLLLLVYYIFGLIGVDLFGTVFPDWFGSLGKALYTLFQVMTLESWSMGISRPVMEAFGWAWIYFVSFVLISSFIIMNVVVGIVVNAISEVQEQLTKEREEAHASAVDAAASADESQVPVSEGIVASGVDQVALKKELEALKLQISKIEEMLN